MGRCESRLIEEVGRESAEPDASSGEIDKGSSKTSKLARPRTEGEAISQTEERELAEYSVGIEK